MTEISEDKILTDVISWIREKAHDDKGEIGADSELIASSVLDSLGFLELVSFIEQNFGIEMDPELLTPENFKTASDVARLVNTRIN